MKTEVPESVLTLIHTLDSLMRLPAEVLVKMVHESYFRKRSLRWRRTNSGKALRNFQGGGLYSRYSYGLGVRTLVDADTSESPVGKFGWDGVAGEYALVDPINHISVFYAQEALDMILSYEEIHPAIRDLTYQRISCDTP